MSQLPAPQRSWLIHCTDPNGDLNVCEINADCGTLAIAAPWDNSLFTLERSQITIFRTALEQAIAVAAQDMASP